MNTKTPARNTKPKKELPEKEKTLVFELPESIAANLLEFAIAGVDSISRQYTASQYVQRAQLGMRAALVLDTYRNQLTEKKNDSDDQRLDGQ